MFEAYTLLGALAARTATVKLGTLVTGVTYRNPAILAKIVTTLDVISHGRAFLGIGAAWFDVEHEAPRRRLPAREGALRAARGGAADLPGHVPRRAAHHRGHALPGEGRHQLAGTDPPGGPPIMIGGQGEKKTLRLMAQYAEMANFTVRRRRAPPQARGPGRPLRRRRARPRHHQQDRRCASVVVGDTDGGGRGHAQRLPPARGLGLGRPRRRPPRRWSTPAWWSATPTPWGSRSSDADRAGPRRHRPPTCRPTAARPRGGHHAPSEGLRRGRRWLRPGFWLAGLARRYPALSVLPGPSGSGAEDRNRRPGRPDTPREPHGTTPNHAPPGPPCGAFA